MVVYLPCVRYAVEWGVGGGDKMCTYAFVCLCERERDSPTYLFLAITCHIVVHFLAFAIVSRKNRLPSLVQYSVETRSQKEK